MSQVSSFPEPKDHNNNNNMAGTECSGRQTVYGYGLDGDDGNRDQREKIFNNAAAAYRIKT